MRTCGVAICWCALLASPLAASEPYACCGWEKLFPPRAVIVSLGEVASAETRYARQLQSLELDRIDAEIEYAQADVRAWERRLNDLESVNRFKYSYAFSMDEEGAKLRLMRARIQLAELQRARMVELGRR